jgi:hypothetical protein
MRHDATEGWSAADDASASRGMTLDDANMTHQGGDSFATVGDGSDADDVSIFLGDQKPEEKIRSSPHSGVANGDASRVPGRSRWPL